MIADSVYRNGKIFTVDSDNSWADAVAIKDGRFIYIGPETQAIDLQGNMAMLGLHDMHIHGVEGALSQLFHCNFPFTATVDEVVAAVKTFAQDRPKEVWIISGAWLMEAYAR